ncbi:Potassium voltage-gated channel subfamily H member 7 [Porphyridium purpureum]|uniref:Potassium voltage-gated channel subfamily H member 7 n=1 Tax=Porphyridium purpureum TaxID=35688 RepID=A0A5J4Z7C6_PORPP|nr:Potassium voltage-gated channel subfamily H member 7 [Porphyridium purpureum]|eukprot:POR8017..scf295_1
MRSGSGGMPPGSGAMSTDQTPLTPSGPVSRHDSGQAPSAEAGASPAVVPPHDTDVLHEHVQGAQPQQVNDVGALSSVVQTPEQDSDVESLTAVPFDNDTTRRVMSVSDRELGNDDSIRSQAPVFEHAPGGQDFSSVSASLRTMVNSIGNKVHATSHAEFPQGAGSPRVSSETQPKEISGCEAFDPIDVTDADLDNLEHAACEQNTGPLRRSASGTRVDTDEVDVQEEEYALLSSDLIADAPPSERSVGASASHSARQRDRELLQSALKAMASEQENKFRIEAMPETRLYIPPDSKFLPFWAMCIFIAVIYSSIVTVYVACFLGTMTTSDWYWYGELLLTLLFVADFVLAFFTGFVEEDGHSVVSQKEICIHYLRTWFLPDLLGMIPWPYIAFAIQPNVAISGWNLLSFISMLKVFKIPVLWQSVRGSDTFVWLEVRFNIKGEVALMFLFLIFGVLAAHWIACLFYFFALLNNPSATNTWVESAGLVGNVFESYVLALYFATSIATTTGYGNVVPISIQERVYTSFAMAIGASFYVYVIGNLSGIIARLGASRSYYRELDDALRAFCIFYNIPDELHFRIRRFFVHQQQYNPYAHTQQFLGALSVELHAKVNLETYGDFANRSVYLHDMNSENIASVYASAVQLSFAPGETVFLRHTWPLGSYVVVRGTCTERSPQGETLRSFGPDSVFGEEGLVCYKRRMSTVVSEGYSDLLLLPIKDLLAGVQSCGALPSVLHFESLRSWAGFVELASTRARMRNLSRKLLQVAKAMHAEDFSRVEEEEARAEARIQVILAAKKEQQLGRSHSLGGKSPVLFDQETSTSDDHEEVPPKDPLAELDELLDSVEQVREILQESRAIVAENLRFLAREEELAQRAGSARLAFFSLDADAARDTQGAS